MDIQPAQAGWRAFVRRYSFYFLAPFGILLLALLLLYAIYGPKVFVAFLYAGT